MCPFGDSNKDGQLKLVKERDLTTEQWKSIFDKVSKYCVWSIIDTNTNLKNQGCVFVCRIKFVQAVYANTYLRQGKPIVFTQKV